MPVVVKKQTHSSGEKTYTQHSIQAHSAMHPSPDAATATRSRLGLLAVLCYAVLCWVCVGATPGTVTLSMARDLPVMVEYRISDMGHLR